MTPRGLAEILRLADLNMWAGYRHLVGRAHGGEMLDDGGVLCVAGRSPSPFIVNTAFRTDPSLGAELALERIDAFYADLEHGYCVATAEHGDPNLAAAAVAAGLEHVIDLPAMVLDAPPQLPDPLPEARVLEVTDYAETLAYAAIMAETFSDPVSELYGESGSLVGPGLGGWVAYVDGEPAACASILLSHGIGLVVTVGTREAYRRRGLGALVTRVAARAAFARGARFVSLQSSPEAVPVYERIGFKVISGYRLYGRGAPDR